ncbi:MAG: hypothetical protein JWQ57_10 [Mucilaginibacter sp.]|nr:hypothetical protein [Mucilaginibacter sp.]
MTIGELFDLINIGVWEKEKQYAIPLLSPPRKIKKPSENL